METNNKCKNCGNNTSLNGPFSGWVITDANKKGDFPNNVVYTYNTKSEYFLFVIVV